MLCVPTASVLSVSVAVPPDKVPVPMGEPPFMNVTLPVGVPPAFELTTAVNVTYPK
jgi:hypothetical protein